MITSEFGFQWYHPSVHLGIRLRPFLSPSSVTTTFSIGSTGLSISTATRIFWLSGDHQKSIIRYCRFSNSLWIVPSGFITARDSFKSKPEMYAIQFPLGDQRGLRLVPLSVSCFKSVPSGLIEQIL
ncbi:uncharacterized protein METZ01_LOCUS113038 [marine metagenome]|uniref:Uncharacterized protein n=1 Tax=marine metagenome TaxID=408172 RepID=A0A381X629_9ZZZZ